jgi:hypothetical protein
MFHLVFVDLRKYSDEISIKIIGLIDTNSDDDFYGYTMCQNSKNKN